MNALKSEGVTLLVFVGVFGLLSACGFPEPGTPAPTCDAASLVAPDIPVADSQVADSLRPTFQWFYSGLCTPDGFRVEIAPNGDYASPEVVVGTANAATWTPPADLQTVQPFEWRVAAFSGTNQGPYSISQAFFTGPVCDSPDLLPPVLLEPDTGAWVTNPSPELSWQYPDAACLQTSYKFEVSVDPGFSTHVLSGQGGPWPGFDTNLDYLGEDCTTYFWRVAATWGEDVVGPYAQDFFHTQFGDTCSGQMELAVVNGTLWSDVCAATGVCSGTPPDGCTCREGSIGADGIWQAGEVGIPGVVVRFGTGPCPASGWTGTAVGTDTQGGYYEWLPAGTYCFWIDDAEPGNADILLPGLWTHPVPYDTPLGHTVTVLEGEERTGVDFGWQFLPQTLAGQGSISGSVHASGGNPIANATVCAFDFSTHQMADCVQSGLDGSYSIGELPAAGYRVEVSAAGWAFEMYADYHYGNVSAATRVPVTDGATTSGIDFALEPGGHIRGVVYRSDGTTPISGISVVVEFPDSSTRGVCTSATGRFNINNVPFGIGLRARAYSVGNFCGGPQGYSQEYWQETPLQANAAVLSLSSGVPAYEGLVFTLDSRASIRGVVWSDQCPATGSCPATTPPGCQCLEGTLGGDGVRQPDEPGFEGVNVRIGPGPCSASLSTRQTTVSTLTDADGAFSRWLDPGTYCVWIDALEAANAAVFGEGLWTIPPAYDAPFGYNLTLDPGDTRGDLEFGWWSAGGPAPQSPANLRVEAAQDAFCRFGPGTVYEQTGYLLRGQTAPLLARNAVGTWYYIQEVNGSGQCWIASSLVTVNGDTGGLQVRQAPPTPTPVPSATPTPTVTPDPYR